MDKLKNFDPNKMKEKKSIVFNDFKFFFWGFAIN